uniref:Uncharacterized protein n=1 Tax=viral metagenome TaxID=1070528 RepID=A0A6C0DVS3_9ZZZZ
MDKTLIILYLIAISVIGFLLYSITKKAQPVRVTQVMNKLPPLQSFETHWWGYGWRPWWRKYGGVPGFNPVEGEPLPDPKMPVAPKPLVVNTKPVHY